jgi:two-component sensor histidine kinase
LRDTVEKLALAVDATDLGLWDYDIVSDRLTWDSHLKKMYDVPADCEVTYGQFVSLLHPDDRDLVLATYQAALDPTGDGRFGFEHRVIGGNGVVRWLQAAGRVLFDGERRPIRVLGTSLDVTERKEAEERQKLLIAELDHRVKNTLASVLSIAQLTLGTTDQSLQFAGRLSALARAHSLLANSHWKGGDLRDLAEAALEPYRPTGRIRLNGPPIVLRAKTTEALGLALHELTTNAVKYGALSVPNGSVSLYWKIIEGGSRLQLQWAESGGPAVSPRSNRGFGSMLIEQALPRELDGTVRLLFEPGGVTCDLEFPLRQIESR